MMIRASSAVAFFGIALSQNLLNVIPSEENHALADDLPGRGTCCPLRKSRFLTAKAVRNDSSPTTTSTRQLAHHA
jgi:hypothetical protein